MCFSPTASFTASALLTFIGVKSMQKASKQRLMFASIPLLFAIQQAIEGALWLILLKAPDSVWRMWTGYGFLFFAYIIWPIWIPFCLMIAEQVYAKIRLLKALSIVGIVVAVLLSFQMIINGITVTLQENHIYYSLDIKPLLNVLCSILYVIAVTIPAFVSSIKNIKIFGILLLLSCIITYMIWHTYFTSIWCFFAAILSLGVYLIV